ncbi:RNA polymerase sigma factor [Streptomyces sp. NPDC058000]|uniref:RNA polymerase sigma factor n=1 Tax=Streptomyces sp. NPDC058000 TaxID=3346299 RepID=UPI0036EED540
MGVLLHRVSAGDGRDAELAARVLVQAMLPHACRVLRGCARSGEDIEDVAQVVIASLWEVVRTFPIARRPRKVATGLRLELWHRVSRELKRELAPSEHLDETWAAALPGGVEPEDAVDPVLLARATEEAGLHAAASAVEELEGARGEMVALLVWALECEVLTTEAASGICDHYREGAPQDAAAASAWGG